MKWEILCQIIRMMNDIILIIFFANKIPNIQERSHAYRQLIGFACLLMMAPLYVSETINEELFIDNACLRYIIKLAAIFGYMYCTKALSVKVLAYWTILVNTCLNEGYALFMTPLFKDLRLANYHIVSDTALNSVISTIIECAIIGFVIVIMRWNIRDFNIKRNLKGRIAVVSLITMLTLYIKSTFRFYTYGNIWVGGMVENIFTVIMVTALLVLIMLIERFWSYQEMKIQYEARLMTEDYHYQNMLDKAKAEEDVRRLYHDMKNHLNVLCQMSESSSEMHTYISELSEQLKAYERKVYTGNDTLDIILSMKIKQAQEQNIIVNTFVDFTRGDFIRPIDLCTIFGNAFDNAIEACSKVKNEKDRIILIRVQEYADQLIIKMRNSFEGELVRKGTELVSMKHGDAYMHGLGINNIRRAVSSYGGIVRMDVPERGIFELKILIPIDNQPDNEANRPTD